MWLQLNKNNILSSVMWKWEAQEGCGKYHKHKRKTIRKKIQGSEHTHAQKKKINQFNAFRILNVWKYKEQITYLKKKLTQTIKKNIIACIDFLLCKAFKLHQFLLFYLFICFFLAKIEEENFELILLSFVFWLRI